MSKPLLSPYVFGQSIFNWIALPSEVGETVEIPLPPVDGYSEVLIFVSAISSGEAQDPHYYAVFTRALEGGPVPFHYLFLAGGNAQDTTATNSDNFWLKVPDKGLPRVAYVQKMSGAALPPSDNFKTGIAFLSLR
jgi:hypothetical protein